MGRAAIAPAAAEADVDAALRRHGYTRATAEASAPRVDVARLAGFRRCENAR